MAAFPPPRLVLHLDTPLLGLIQACPGGFSSVRGSHHFADREAILNWFRSPPSTPYEVVLSQFEELLRKVYRHRGPIDEQEAFGTRWGTPFDCLRDLESWRQELSGALVLVDDPPFFEPAWMTETVVTLRDAILAERGFDRLPILADALEEAGCDNHLILNHLRANDDHEHHCWVLDVLNVGNGRPL